ncbi:MAG: hypothetical protein GXO24_00515 [Chlorobi bacterium]|nr:hypothetical protein [Chlorobiota bacterium]
MTDFYTAVPGKAYRRGQIPLFMMHGYGSHEADLFMLASDLPDIYYPVSLRGPLKLAWGGYGWFPLYWTPEGGWTYDKRQMSDTIKALEQWTDRWMQTHETGKIRPALLGFSQGGMMACAMLSRRPAHYGPVALLSTRRMDAVPLPERFPAEDRVFISHGIYDDVIPVDEARQSVKTCREAGLKIDYKEYPQGHYLSEENIRDLAAWLNEHEDTAWG